MVKYSKVTVKLSDSQLKKLKPAIEDKTGTTGGFLGSLLSKLAGLLMKVAISVAKMF